jgi:hypothetical protein
MKNNFFKIILAAIVLYGLYVFVYSRSLSPENITDNHPKSSPPLVISRLKDREMPLENDNPLFAVPQIKQEVLGVQKQKEIVITPSIPFSYLGLVNVENEIRLVMVYQSNMIVMRLGDEISEFKLMTIEKNQKFIKISFLHVPTKTIQDIIVNNEK